MGVLCIKKALMKKHYLLTVLLSASTLVSGYFYGNYQGKMESYEHFIINSAVESVLPIQILYAINSNKIQGSKGWLEHKLCSNLIIIGGVLKGFPELGSNEIVEKSLTMPKLYAKDFNVSFCGSEHSDIEKKALSLADDFPDSYNQFLNQYREVK